jgi:hypothetical protein
MKQNKSFKKIIADSRIYNYVVDLDERGVYKCHVENSNGKTIWQASTEDEEDGEFWPVRDGFMKNGRDMSGLTKYLSEMGIIGKNGRIEYIG